MKNIRKPEQVSLEYRVEQAFEGKYFMGHTPFLTFGHGSHAWGGLINPPNSKINLYVNTFTISNASDKPFNGQLWLNSTPTGKPFLSPYLSPSNTTLTPLPKPHTLIAFAQDVPHSPTDGASLFIRIAEPHSTVVGNYYGKIIIPPGGSFIVFLQSPGEREMKADVAFGWWEENRKK